MGPPRDKLGGAKGGVGPQKVTVRPEEGQQTGSNVRPVEGQRDDRPVEDGRIVERQLCNSNVRPEEGQRADSNVRPVEGQLDIRPVEDGRLVEVQTGLNVRPVEGQRTGLNVRPVEDVRPVEGQIDNSNVRPLEGQLDNSKVRAVEGKPGNSKLQALEGQLESSEGGTKEAWADLFKENKKIENGLKLKGGFEGNQRELKEDDMTESEVAWGICAIGYVLGRFPGMKAIQEIRNSWGVAHKFFVHESGWMVFKFQNEEDRDRVLASGPYESFGFPWLLKEMPCYFNFGDDCFTKIPTWIKLPSLPLECWNERALSKICSYVGEPIATDQYTALRLRPSYARALVEVDVTQPLVREFQFKLPNGKEIHQKVLYDHEPKLCGKCSRVGHDQEKCKGRKPQRRGRSKSRSRKANNGEEQMAGSNDRPGEGQQDVRPVEDGRPVEGQRKGLNVRPVEGQRKGSNVRLVEDVRLEEDVRPVKGQIDSSNVRSVEGQLPNSKVRDVEGKPANSKVRPLLGQLEVEGIHTPKKSTDDVQPNVADKGKYIEKDEASSSIGDARDWHKLWQPIQWDPTEIASCPSLSDGELPTEEKVRVVKAKPKAKKGKKKKGRKGGGSPK